MKQRLWLCIVLCCCFTLFAGCDARPGKKATVTVKIKKPYLYMDYCAEVEQLLWRHTAKAFRRFKAPSDALEDEALQFLKDACHYSSHHNLLPRPVELEARGRQLVEGGVDSAVVRMWWGYLLYKCGDYPESWKQHQYVFLKKTPPMAYLLAAYAADDLCDMAYDNDYPMRAERSRWKKAKAEMLQKAIIAGEFKGDEIHIAYRLVYEKCGTDASKRLLSRLREDGGIDQWLLLMLEGHLEVKEAWEARGSDYAYTVTEAGWKGFNDHLEKARKLLTRASKLHPEYPQAANRMITVAKGGHPGPGESERTWFDQAIEAQPDSLAAHRNYLSALKPRWGGSFEAMEAFGKERLWLGPYNSQAPLFYLMALREIGGDIKYDCWRAVFRRPGVLENLDRLFQTLIEAPPPYMEPDRLRMQHALVLAWCGQYARAREMLNGLPEDMDLRRNIIGDYLSWQGRSHQEIEAELRAFLGPQGKILAAAEQKQHQGDFEAAADLFFKAMMDSQSDREVHAYLRRRIGLMGLDIRAENIHWYATALHYAAQKDNLPVARFLVENGADVDARTKSDSTPLHWAASNGKIDVAHYLIKNGAMIDARDYAKETPLHYAIKKGHRNLALLLIENEANPNAVNRDHFSVFYRATRKGDRQVMKLLLKKGADVDTSTRTKWTPLYYTVRNGEAETLKLLLDNNADPNLCADNQFPPLIEAVYIKSIKKVQLLLKHGANVNVVHAGKDGWTPLLVAADGGNETIVRMLLEAGADDTICLSNGADAAEVARVHGHQKLWQLLQHRK